MNDRLVGSILSALAYINTTFECNGIVNNRIHDYGEDAYETVLDYIGECNQYASLRQEMTNDSPITETSRVSKLILVLGSQPAGNQSHKPSDRLPLLSFRHAVTALATKQHCPSAGTKLHLLVTEAHVCKQLTVWLQKHKYYH